MTVRVGSGDFTYEVDLNWAKLPDGWNLHEVADVVTDGEDRVYIMSRSEHPVIVLDRDGNLLRSWGEGVFTRPHGITLGPDGLLYCVDDGDHTVRKCTLDGQVLQVIGTPGQPAPYQSGQPFNRPTKVAFDPETADLYISDGYGNARVHKVAPDGRRLFSWGEYGCEPGQFNLVHSVVTDRQGLVYVADRENHRIQVFDPQGQYLTQWNNMHRPCGLHIVEDGGTTLFYVGQLPGSLPINQNYPNIGARVSVHTPDGKCVAWMGDVRAGDSRPEQFIAPHGLAVDSHGDVYVGEVSWSFLGRYLDPPREFRCFRKLIRVR